jgi:hypothetical protein
MLMTLYITFHVRSEFVKWWMIPVFTVTYPVQLGKLSHFLIPLLRERSDLASWTRLTDDLYSPHSRNGSLWPR